MHRANREAAAGRLLLGFLALLLAGFVVASVYWRFVERFRGSCEGQPPPFAELYYTIGWGTQLLILVATVLCGWLFVRAERELGRSHHLGVPIGLCLVAGLGVYQYGSAWLAHAAIHPFFCF